MCLFSSTNTDKGNKSKTVYLSSKEYFTIFHRVFCEHAELQYLYLLDKVYFCHYRL